MSSQREQERRGKRRENRHERREKQHSGGGDWDCLKLPEGVEVFKPEKDETYHIDVLPYIVGNHNKNADPGDEYFELSYPIYRNLGIDEKKYIAIGELLGKRDPVAEHFAALRKKGAEWDDMKEFKHAWRQLMLVFVHEQADKGLQLWEGAYGTFGELLDEEIKANEESWVDNFDDPDHGATVVVRFKEKDIGAKNKWILASKINFSEREDGFTADGDKKLAAEVLAKAAAICLDDLLKITDYDTLKKALDGEPMGDTDDDDKPAKKDGGRDKRRPADKDTDDTDDEDDDDEDDVPTKKAAKSEAHDAKKKSSKDEDDDDDADTDDDEDDDKPAKKGAKKDDADTDDDKPAAGGKKSLADKLGIVKGGVVTHDDHGKCTVLKVADDGATCTLMDADDDVHKGVDVTDVEPVGETGADDGATDKPASGSKDVASAKKKGAAGNVSPSKKDDKKKGADDDWDDDWDDDDKPAAKGGDKKKK